MLRYKAIPRFFLVPFALIFCAAIVLGSVHPSLAMDSTPSTVTAKDFYVPSGIDPWGTTFDTSADDSPG